MPITAHPFDVYAWYRLSTGIVQNGPIGVQIFPPLWGYMLTPIAYGYDWLSKIAPVWMGAYSMNSLPSAFNPDPTVVIAQVPGVLFNFAVKVPFLISDVLMTLLLYKIVVEYTNNRKLAEKGALLWFLNPLVIWISAAWGMWDTLPALLSMASVFFLVKKKIAFSAVCLSLSVALKLYPALFLVPIAFFLFRTDRANRWKNIARFLSVFSVSSLLLFVPYLNYIANFFVGSFGANSGVAAGSGGTPISLSYWSVASLNLLLNIPVNNVAIQVASTLSTVLVVVFIGLSYWKTSKFTFQKPIFDLFAAFLLSLLALFLSYRMVLEQWILWVLPFIVFFSAIGKVKSSLFWAVSFVAFVFAAFNCLLPLFFLPLAPWVGDVLLPMITWMISVWQQRIIFLAVLSIMFSSLLLMLTFKLNRNGP